MNLAFFEIPDDDEVKVKLVEAIPDNWSFLDGQLNAPKSAINAGLVQEDTGFAVARFHSIKPTIIGRYDQKVQGRVEPNLFAIMVDGKLPGFVSFDEAGLEARSKGDIKMALSKRIVIGFIRKGYLGGLHFYSDCISNNKYYNPARCDMAFQPWDAGPLYDGECGPQPARIKLSWADTSRGQIDIDPLRGICLSLGLRQYEPAVVSAV